MTNATNDYYQICTFLNLLEKKIPKIIYVITFSEAQRGNTENSGMVSLTLLSLDTAQYFMLTVVYATIHDDFIFFWRLDINNH